MDYIESAADFIIRSTEYPFVVGPSLRPPGFPSPRGCTRGRITFIRTLLINDKISSRKSSSYSSPLLINSAALPPDGPFDKPLATNKSLPPPRKHFPANRNPSIDELRSPLRPGFALARSNYYAICMCQCAVFPRAFHTRLHERLRIRCGCNLIVHNAACRLRPPPIGRDWNLQ